MRVTRPEDADPYLVPGAVVFFAHSQKKGSAVDLDRVMHVGVVVDVTIGVPNPDAVDTSAVAKELPYGTVTVKAVKGGLEIPADGGGDAITIANAPTMVLPAPHGSTTTPLPPCQKPSAASF